MATAKRAAGKPRRPSAYTPTVKAVRRELAQLEERREGIKDSALAAGAIAVAKRLDHPDTTAAAAASCLRALERTMTALHALAPAEEDQDPIDALAQQLAARLAAP